MPAGVKRDGCFKPPGGSNSVPIQYACNKGIGQLSTEDIAAVRQQLIKLAGRVHFEVKDIRNTAVIGLTDANDKPSDSEVRGWDSTIFVSRRIYQRALLWTSSNRKNTATMVFDIAILLLHEVTHALGNSLMGLHVEDFFEASLVAENGWELESRLFGICPHINDTNLSKSYWYTWQTYEGLNEGHDLDLICRHVWKLPKRKSKYPFDRNFAVKLVSDTFWDHDYVKHGALALIPQVVQQLYRSGKQNNTTRGIPQSIRDLFQSGGRSYAEKKYGQSANPDRVVRLPPVAPKW
jgi:hypothetical protein